ncbi:MAG TPA: tetratricopeptide repeat protein, partial [Thermoanaerobaculia bacterium]
QDAGLHNNYAAALARSGDDQRALAEYESALSLNPNLYDAHMNYGALLSRLDRNEAAAQHFQDAARLRPRSPEPHIYLAVLEASQSRFDVAAKEAESAIAIDHDASNRLLINAIRIPARPTAIDEYLAFLRQQSGHR